MNAGMMGLGRYARSGGILDNVLTPWLGLLVVVLIVLVLCFIKERIARCQAQDNYESARGELQALRGRPEIHEFRLERFDLVWFPEISISSHDRMILGVTPGVPHCRGCLIPLSLQSGNWTCRQCSGKYPESLADLSVLDSISKQALTWFQQRHPGFRTAPKT